jgi:uncharacterized protein DUF3592
VAARSRITRASGSAATSGQPMTASAQPQSHISVSSSRSVAVSTASSFVQPGSVQTTRAEYMTSQSVQTRSDGMQEGGQSVGHAGDRTLLAFPVVRFSLPNGRTVETQSTWGTNPPPAKPGAQVTVLYDPADPTRASVPAGGTASLVSWVIVALGGLLVFIGLAAAVVLAMVL